MTSLNGYCEPELAIQLTKNTKNITATPHKNNIINIKLNYINFESGKPQYALYEKNAPNLLPSIPCQITCARRIQGL
jgi:hypothetical protein